jgi:hypothetical protein
MKNHNKNRKRGGDFRGCCCYVKKEKGPKTKKKKKKIIYNQTVLSDASHPSWLNLGTFWKKKKNLKHIQNIFRETCKELGRKVTQGRHLPITMNTSACIYIH